MSFESLPPTVRNALNDACDEYEAAWNGAPRPLIEDFLSARTEAERTVLLEMLLGVEVELRRKAGDRPEPGEYLERFEAYTEVIRTVFDELESRGAAQTTEVAGNHQSNISLATTLAARIGSEPPAAPAGRNDVVARVVPETIGRFRVIRLLGHGNFDVYLARDPIDHADVAIKVASPHDPAGRRRLMSLADEAEKLQALDHPRIVKLLEFVPANDQASAAAGADGYIVLEYVEGQTLEELLRAGPLPVLRLARIVALVAEALHHTHTRGVVHRDLKPSNILLDRDGEPRVCDFGLALDEEIQRLRRGEVAGTLHYMAPEQARGETHRLDGRTDVWALGVILYRGLTGRLPFPGRDQDEIFDEILRRDPKPPRMYDPSIEVELERICLRCLSRRMAERYLTAHDLAVDLKRLIRELPPPSILASYIIPPKGLRPFDTDDARVFRALLPGPRRGDGTPESVQFWKDRIEAVDDRPVFSVGVLYGPSGGGKSSFVRAGVLPSLDRDRVRPVYLDATPTGLEARLSAALIREAPALPSDVNLPQAIALLRDDAERRSSRKILLVIDQFEQWLQAHPNEPDAELVQALRQCDGKSVQALVLVRDDFWMAVTRFLRAVDAPLVLGGNAAAVEPFDARHARRVLAAFGQALGQLADDGTTESSEGSLFLDEAVHGLAGPDNRVIPVQLSLFTEVVRNRPWTPATLQELGGVDGIAVKFLDDCFASTPYKRRRVAAQAVLTELLPAPASQIRGTPRISNDLHTAAAVADPSGDFGDLMRVLDAEMRLISATDPEGSSPPPRGLGQPPQPVAGETYYQLAHDYLVRPIRHWLERDQTSTREGRARLRLRLVTTSWLDRPGRRQLPSVLEWVGILRHVRPKDWSPAERLLMRTAARHYLARTAAAAALLFALALGATFYLERVAAHGVLDQAFTAHDHELPGLVSQIKPYYSFLASRLEAEERNDESSKREVAGLILYELAPTAKRGRYLGGLLRAAPNPERVQLIRRALAAHPQHAGTETLHRDLLDPTLKPAVLLRIASALTLLEPDRFADLTPISASLTRSLLAEDRGTIPGWLGLLRPVLHLVAPSLSRFCCDSDRDPTTRAIAAETLGEILKTRGDAGELARQVVLSRPDASRILLRTLVRMDRGPSAPQVLHSMLAAQSAKPRDEALAEDDARLQANAAVALAAIDEPKQIWARLRHHDDPSVRALLIQRLAGSELPPRLLLDRLRVPDLDPTEIQAILLTWAETSRGAVAEADEVEVAAVSRTLYLSDPHPGVHSAADLLLRRWSYAPPPVPAATTTHVRERADGPRWEHGPNGHVLAVLPGPLVFRMGSPQAEKGRFPDRLEDAHYRRIDRSLAVSVNEVSIEQFREFNTDHKQDPHLSREPGCPANSVSWFDAVAYCNWLSGKAGIDPVEWCYPSRVGDAVVVSQDAVDKLGYRLPTEAEWEYFCRAHTQTSRPCGPSEELLPRYALTWLNLGDQTSPVARLLPNEFGLFDVLGNLWEWCHDGPDPGVTGDYSPYPAGTKETPASDVMRAEVVDNNVWRFVRGGAYSRAPSAARSAHRDRIAAWQPLPQAGFRVVKTLARDSK
jgi:eukaryotic-like serine/threonine-protein kinase